MNEFSNPQATADKTKNMVGKAADALQDGLNSAHRSANTAVDAVADKADDMQGNAMPSLDKATDQAQKLMRQGRDMVQDSAQKAREKALDFSDKAVSYTKDEPVKAMLMSAAAGAVLISVLSMLTRSRR